ncbi:MAG: dephospho-CoA kinase [Myxococcales bacterium]|nr:MAG: dephospho-CoA kinase [Myxococcales bacterium]
MQALSQALQHLGMKLIETHISWVFLDDCLVYKLKKPVCFDFLDYSTLEKRKEACLAEIALNQRLAPDVYLGLSYVTKEQDGRYVFDGEGELVDYAVRMKRLPDTHRADIRLTNGSLSIGDIVKIASHIASFHSRARCDEYTAQFATVDAVQANVEGNFVQTKDTLERYLDKSQIDELHHWHSSFLLRNSRLFLERIAAKRVCDGHGDLRLEHIYLDAQKHISILDCIEFNERFRFADVCADIAFVSMDLAWHGRVDLAEYFLSVYAQQSNDYGFYRLIDFYQSYRAQVRGKVASIVASDEHAVAQARQKAIAEARRYYLVALSATRKALSKNCVVAIGGIIASGKSTVADALSQQVGLPVVQSDRVRKHVLGVAPMTAVPHEAFKGAYAKEMTDNVYEMLFAHADKVLQSGRAVVLDASFSSRKYRAKAKVLAEKHGVPFYFLECKASRAVCLERLELRAEEKSVSDGRAEIFDAFVNQWERVTEFDSSEYFPLDTTGSLQSCVDHLRKELPLWPVAKA